MLKQGGVKIEGQYLKILQDKGKGYIQAIQSIGDTGN